MNHVKDYLQTLEIYDILTCADNEAVTYFRKQGFNKHEIMNETYEWFNRYFREEFEKLRKNTISPE